MNKFKYLILMAMILACAGCGWFSAGPVADDGEKVAKQEIPFAVKEPERYSADVVVKTNAGGKVLTTEYFIARSGANRFEKFSIGNEDEFAVLVTDIKASFRLFPKTKQYEGLKNSGLASAPGSMSRSMTNRWLNAEKPVSFVELGTENELKKYRAEIEDSKNTEIIIFVDQKLNYPVKQEVWSVADGKRELVYSMELRNISLTPDPKLFVIPSDYTIKPERRDLGEK